MNYWVSVWQSWRHMWWILPNWLEHWCHEVHLKGMGSNTDFPRRKSLRNIWGWRLETPKRSMATLGPVKVHGVLQETETLRGLLFSWGLADAIHYLFSFQISTLLVYGGGCIDWMISLCSWVNCQTAFLSSLKVRCSCVPEFCQLEITSRHGHWLQDMPPQNIIL